MKIAYLSNTQLSDVDLSYLHVAQTMADITCYLEITPRYLKGAVINIDKCYPKSGVFSSDIYEEFSKFADFIDLSKVRVANTSGKRWVLKAIWTNIKLLKELKREKYDVIHISWPLNIYEFPLYVLRNKIVLTVHDPLPHSGGMSIISNFRRYCALRYLKNFIILNHCQKEEFIKTYKLGKRNVFESRLSYYSCLQAIAQKSKQAKERNVLFFGLILSYKGLEYLFPAFERVHEKHPEVSLIVAGSGKYYFDISQYKDKPYFKILNRFIPADELASLIKNSEFTVCPYKDATQSGVAMSAFAFCKPVLATEVGGLPEMLGYGKYGMLIPPCDVDSLADAMSLLLDNQELLVQYSNNIEEDYVHGDMSWDKICKEHLEIYKAVAK